MNRRRFVATASSLIAPALLIRQQSAKTRLILLGTGGGPRPRVDRTASSQVIIVNNAAYVVDCGDGVAQRLAAAKIPLQTLRHIFITHQHSDHNLDYGNVIQLAWAVGLETRLDTWGPPPLEQMTKLFLELNEYDIDIRIKDESYPPLAPLVHPHDVTQGGVVLNEGPVKVTAALVNHPPVEPAFAYRFDTPDRSIVISGDTTASESLIQLAKGADVLVHEAMHMKGVERLVARVPNHPGLRQHLLASHTPVEDVGRVAQEAGVKLLVLSHLVPADDPSITDEMWIEGARVHYHGRVIVGKDLLEI